MVHQQYMLPDNVHIGDINPLLEHKSSSVTAKIYKFYQTVEGIK